MHPIGPIDIGEERFGNRLVAGARQCFGQFLCDSDKEPQWVAGRTETPRNLLQLVDTNPLTWKGSNKCRKVSREISSKHRKVGPGRSLNKLEHIFLLVGGLEFNPRHHMVILQHYWEWP